MTTKDSTVFLTEDGSHSVQSVKFGVSYHSKFGAVLESKHVFLKMGLDHLLEKTKDTSIQILEVGFGTGLNALLTALHLKDKAIAVSYDALEAYPLETEIIASLNYGKCIEDPETQSVFNTMHKAEWNQSSEILPNFSLKKWQRNFEDVNELDVYDLVYFDAFAPTAQPDLWKENVLELFVDALKPGGVLTTYCAKGDVRRTFQALGCTVERLPGPPGKREMLRITKL